MVEGICGFCIFFIFGMGSGGAINIILGIIKGELSL